MNKKSDSLRGTMSDKFEQLKRIVKVEETQQDIRDTKQSRTQRDFLKKHNKTVCVTSCQNVCSNTQQSNPIILQKATKRQNSQKRSTKIQPLQVLEMRSTKPLISKKIQSFEPIQVPTIDRKVHEISIPKQRKEPQEIQILIQKDTDDKQCLKKLFKKLNKLTEQLNESQKNRIRLQSQLQNYKGFDIRNKQMDKKLRDAETDRHKLQLDVASLAEKLQLQKSKPPVYIDKIIEKPVEIIKQVPVEKIVQVQIQVLKYIPGPERIVDKIVEVPKYVQIQRKVPYEVIKQVIKQVPRQIIKRVEVPQYIEKPIYIDKPVYIDKQVPVSDPYLQTQITNLIAQVRRLQSQLSGALAQNESLRYRLSQQRLRKPIQTPVYYDRIVEKPIQVPIEVPVVVDRPVMNQEAERRNIALKQQNTILLGKISTIEIQLNEYRVQNESLKLKISELYRNVEILKMYNQQKNRQVQVLISNSFDSERRFQYLPTHAQTTSYTSAYVGNYGRTRDQILQRRL